MITTHHTKAAPDKEILFLSSNKAKLTMGRERLSRYNLRLIQKEIHLDEPQDLDVEKVAVHKAKHALSLVEKPFIIEDSGFVIPALNGFPGALAKYAIFTLGPERLCKLVRDESDKTAYFHCVLVHGDPTSNTLKVFTGKYEGTICNRPQGNTLRGWTPFLQIFIPKGWNKTLASMTDEEWEQCFDEYRYNDHYDKFGRWHITQNHE